MTFFSQLLYQHLVVLLSEFGYDFVISNAAEFRERCFVRPTFDELVKASEGVPRDALNIAGLAAAVAGDKTISVHSINVAARDYFLLTILARGEGRAVNDGTDVMRLLDTSRAFQRLRTGWVINLPTGAARS